MRHNRCLGALSCVSTVLRPAHTRTGAKIACVDLVGNLEPAPDGTFGKVSAARKQRPMSALTWATLCGAHVHGVRLKLDPHRADCHSSIWHLPVALEGTTSMDGLMEGTWHLQRWEALNSPSRRSQRRAPGTATPHAQVELAQSRGSCP